MEHAAARSHALDEMTMPLLRLAVSSFDCCGEAMTWKRAGGERRHLSCPRRTGGTHVGVELVRALD
jgi:hypothetical protein